jgi:hypothetical protein
MKRSMPRQAEAERERRAWIISAVTIVDDWQGRGLGTELLAQLSDRARREGIRYFTALASAGKVAVAGLLRNVSAELVRRGPGTVEYKIALAPEERHNPGRCAGTPGVGPDLLCLARSGAGYGTGAAAVRAVLLCAATRAVAGSR